MPRLLQRLCPAAQQCCEEQPGMRNLHLGGSGASDHAHHCPLALLSPPGKELSSPHRCISPTAEAPSPSLRVGPPPGVPLVTSGVGGQEPRVTLWAGAHSKHRNVEIRRRQEPPMTCH